MAKIEAVTQEESDPFVIEKGIPRKKAGRSFKYPFGQLAVGDSFFIGDDGYDAKKVRSSAVQYGRRNKKKFSILKNEKGEYRCWRIK